MRVCFLGVSQNIASYARRLSRRIVEHPSKLFEMADQAFPDSIVASASRTAARAPKLSSRRRQDLSFELREATTADAAVEATAFFKSCSGGVCYVQGDLVPMEAIALLGELKVIFRSVTGANVKPTPPAPPSVEDIVYRPNWIPRSASSCSVAGSVLISDACGRVPR